MAQKGTLLKRALDEGDDEAVWKHMTSRERAFCQEYLVDYKPTEACIRAGYAKTYANRQAYTLLRKPQIQAGIARLSLSKQAKIVAIDPDYVIARVVEIVNADGSKDSDRLRGLDLLARHLGMFVDKTEITGKDGGAIEVLNRKVEEESATFTERLRQLAERASSEKADKKDAYLG